MTIGLAYASGRSGPMPVSACSFPY